ncbi:VOC family protein [Roseomonas haemaphysalidis]|uniref:VOC family protein n=1 Tax=Roseomonas haemaphysalidis TaxID=2768162 RepID=A0ABS3KTG4_9PROT|nr:VOC family protein [Roseomonas haemaphysalidis]MBO1079908.1 VOC family protein [Roseomonas haemaphysalidis]
MPKLIFINLPVADLSAATAFYEAVGAQRNPQFSDGTAACMVLSDTIHVMLLTHEKFTVFSKRPRPDPRATTGVLLCLSADSRDAVNDMVARAAAAGGRADPNPTQDYGFMLGRSFEDPDGHVWEVMHMDLAAAQAAMGKS